MPERRAVIDVGTNSVKLLVADVAATTVTPVWEGSEQTRLGEGFFETALLQPEPMARTVSAVVRFAGEARARGASRVRAIATSAARDARNRAEFAQLLEAAARLPVEIISGDREAELVFAGVMTDPSLNGRPALILDVGGGSTELILGDGRAATCCQSFLLGTVRELERWKPADPPTLEQWNDCAAALQQFMSGIVRTALAPAWAALGGPAVELVGTGGTATILARIEMATAEFDRARIEATRLSREAVRAQCRRLWRLPLEERQRVPGLPSNRADVMLMGAAIYEVLMEEFAFAELRVSTRGLRFAAVADGNWEA